MSEIPKIVAGSTNSPENELPKPKLNIRPHHLLDERVQQAMLGIKQNAIDLAEMLSLLGSPQYYQDIVGSSTDSKGKFIAKIDQFYAELATLSDNDWITSTLAPDGMCSGCSIGAHCSATNFTYTNNEEEKSKDTNYLESTYLSALLHQLKNQGLRENIDYFIISSIHEFHDFSGNPFFSSNYEKININFAGLLVRVGALRTALDPDGAIRAQIPNNLLDAAQ